MASVPLDPYNSQTRHAGDRVVSGRRKWKTTKEKTEPVWPPYIEAALLDGRSSHFISRLCTDVLKDSRNTDQILLETRGAFVGFPNEISSFPTIFSGPQANAGPLSKSEVDCNS